jgi:CheY-like chemotaxis protein
MHKKRILIVDDDVSSTRLTKLNLEATNRFDVRIEKWPEDTLATAREYKPDLIILDIMMPGLFGGDVAERLRADPQFRFVPILFVSAAVRKLGWPITTECWLDFLCSPNQSRLRHCLHVSK